MSQNSMVIPNTNGATFRTNLNNSLDTAVTNNSGASAPSSPTAGYTWYDTATDAIKARNAGNTAWYRLIDDTTAVTIAGVKTFSSSPIIPTPTNGDSTTKAASTAFVAAAIPYNAHAATSKATPVDADEIGLIDSAASWVLKKLTWANLKATLFASPALTGTPTSTTPSVGDSSTKIATTAYVNAEISGDVGVANSSLVKTALNASGTPPIYAARAILVVNGATSAIAKNGNIATFTRHGTGNYEITFTDAMPDANYIITGTASGPNQSEVYSVYQNSGYAPTVNGCRFFTAHEGGSYDSTRISIAIIC